MNETYYNLGLISMACFLQRLSHLDIDSCRGVTSLALTSGASKLSPDIQLISPNQAGLAGCTFLHYLNVSKCPAITLESIDTLVEKLGSTLKVDITNNRSAKGLGKFLL